LLTKLYFQTTPLYNFYDNIWLLEEVPEKILEEIGLPRQDLGVDLIAQAGDQYHAIQCKYHSNKHQAVTYKEVSTFLSAIGQCDKITMGYICSSANVTSKNYEKIKKKPISKILADTWENYLKNFLRI
jgi:predicted helicase